MTDVIENIKKKSEHEGVTGLAGQPHPVRKGLKPGVRIEHASGPESASEPFLVVRLESSWCGDARTR